MSIDRIDDGQLYEQGRFHSCADDVPGLTADEMQEFMDYIPRRVLIPKVNEVIDAFEELDCYSKAEADTTFCPSLKGKELGNPLGITDMIEARHNAKITLLSKNLMTFPYVSESGTVNGITYTVQDDGTVLLDGTATANSSFLLVFDMNKLMPDGIVPGEQYTVSCTSDKNVSKCNFNINYYNEPPKNLNYLSWLSVGVGGGSKTAFLPEDTVAIRAYVSVSSGATVSNATLFPQIERGDKATDFAIFTKDMSGLTVTVTDAEGQREYLSDGNGVIEGVPCLAPSMELTCENPSVIMQVEYLQDLNLAFEKLKKQIKGA